MLAVGVWILSQWNADSNQLFSAGRALQRTHGDRGQIARISSDPFLSNMAMTPYPITGEPW